MPPPDLQPEPLLPRPARRRRQLVLWVLLPLLGFALVAFDEVLHVTLHERNPRAWWMITCAAVGAGLILALMVGLAIRQFRGEAERWRYMSALESLNRVSAAISARIGQGPEVLAELAEAARKLLGVTQAGVLVLEPNQRAARVASVAGVRGLTVGTRYELSSHDLLRTCVVEGRMVIVDDTACADVHGEEAVELGRLGIRSLALAPLRAEGRIIGVLAVGDDRPRRLGEADRRLVELWASQAAVILQNQTMCLQLQQAVSEQRRSQEQRESLVALSFGIYAGTSPEASLQTVADRAPDVLGVDAVVIAQLVDAERQAWSIAAVTDAPENRALRGLTFVSADGPAHKALRRREAVEVPDAARESRLHPLLREKLGIGSILFLPMHVAAPDLLMALIQRRPATFTAEQRQLAQYLAGRIGSALETARLHQQALADARAKAMLLRELHHRVKNNLAGIVSLLSINQPPLTAEARQWLDRVIERIRAMARAHELFTADAGGLGLSEVLRVVLSALSVVKPPGVRIEMNLGDVEATLSAERAVALVMILHELCHNAIVHGLGPQGVLRIDATLLPLRQLLISVIDDGSAPREAIAHFSSGMGLELVQGLVKRELHGQMNLRPAAGGGTAALVQFRLLDSEQVDVLPQKRRERAASIAG